MAMHCFSGLLGCFLREWAIAGNFDPSEKESSSEEQSSEDEESNNKTKK
tara:strand:- start:92 stop:238 length:147 start_codon:yes stop_codon:yes gene_type:complete